ncbi:hypothetical protein ABZ743_21825 [Streptomyces sp. NPDC006662]|uniref:hypothetical protein n=1 Tax=Streptomyces sp. NPDC006662 TaxID=3156902 RepID=UPI0033FAD6C9
MPQAEEQGIATRPGSSTADQPPGRAARLRTVVLRSGLLPAFLVLTLMMVALWLTGMPFLQALTLSTGVKIAVALVALRRPPAPRAGEPVRRGT